MLHRIVKDKVMYKKMSKLQKYSIFNKNEYNKGKKV